MTGLLLGLLVPVLIVSGLIYLAVRRGLQMRELCDHGIDATGQIFSKRSISGAKSSSRRWKLGYRYTDSSGATHEHTSVVSIEQYQKHDEGGPIEVVYSSKRPEISSPKYLVDECMKALGKK
jgi:hypothetical protein